VRPSVYNNSEGQETVDILQIEHQIRIKQNPPHITLASWFADYADPDNFLRVDVHLDVPGWRNAAYERLLDHARQMTDQAARLSLYQEADRLLMDEAVLVPLLYSRHHILLKPWIRHFTIPAIKNPGFWKDFVIEPH
jgi:oligopeptide transport system substrate-binding protein